MAIGDSIGVLGGYVVATQTRHMNSGSYLKNTIDFMTTSDVTSGLWKAAVFGLIIALMGCYNGYYSKGGAQGVGQATTNAVVSASILILAANYLMTSVLFSHKERPQMHSLRSAKVSRGDAETQSRFFNFGVMAGFIPAIQSPQRYGVWITRLRE